MTNSKQTVAAICTLTLLASALSVVAGQLNPNSQSKVDIKQPSATVRPGVPQTDILNKDLWPMVNVDRDANKSKVDVHVPLFFDMTNDNGVGKSKLDLSVLSGLVTVNRDKSRQANGLLTGPLTVTVFGIPVYTGASNVARSSSSPSDTIVTSREAKSLAPLVETKLLGIPVESKVVPTIQDVGQTFLKSFVDLFSKTGESIQQFKTVQNLNGNPADNTIMKYVVPSTFLVSDLQQKTPKPLLSKKDNSEPPRESHV